jgi:hypothetical protein
LRGLSQPKKQFFVPPGTFNTASTGYEEGIDWSAQSAESMSSSQRQPAVCHYRSAASCTGEQHLIRPFSTRVFPDEELRCANKNLKRASDVKDLSVWRRKKDDHFYMVHGGSQPF